MFEVSNSLQHHLHLATVSEVAFEIHPAYSGAESQLSMNFFFFFFGIPQITDFLVEQKRKTNKLAQNAHYTLLYFVFIVHILLTYLFIHLFFFLLIHYIYFLFLDIIYLVFQ